MSEEVAVWTNDIELLEAIGAINVEGVEFSRAIFDSLDSPENIIACIEFGTSVFTFLAALLSLIASRKSKNKVEVYVRVRKCDVDTQNLIARYEEYVRVEVQERE